MSAPPRTVVFVCLHGAAKSVLAAAALRRLAASRGLALEAVAAGTEPESAIAPAVVQALLAEAVDLRGQQPRRLTRDDLACAWRAVSFGCDLAAVAPPGLVVERWDDVPAVGADLRAARAAIDRRVERLLDAHEGGLR